MGKLTILFAKKHKKSFALSLCSALMYLIISKLLMVALLNTGSTTRQHLNIELYYFFLNKPFCIENLSIGMARQH